MKRKTFLFGHFRNVIVTSSIFNLERRGVKNGRRTVGSITPFFPSVIPSLKRRFCAKFVRERTFLLCCNRPSTSRHPHCPLFFPSELSAFVCTCVCVCVHKRQLAGYATCFCVMRKLKRINKRSSL